MPERVCDGRRDGVRPPPDEASLSGAAGGGRIFIGPYAGVVGGGLLARGVVRVIVMIGGWAEKARMVGLVTLLWGSRGIECVVCVMRVGGDGKD